MVPIAALLIIGIAATVAYYLYIDNRKLTLSALGVDGHVYTQPSTDESSVLYAAIDVPPSIIVTGVNGVNLKGAKQLQTLFLLPGAHQILLYLDASDVLSRDDQWATVLRQRTKPATFTCCVGSYEVYDLCYRGASYVEFYLTEKDLSDHTAGVSKRDLLLQGIQARARRTSHALQAISAKQPSPNPDRIQEVPTLPPLTTFLGLRYGDTIDTIADRFGQFDLESLPSGEQVASFYGDGLKVHFSKDNRRIESIHVHASALGRLRSTAGEDDLLKLIGRHRNDLISIVGEPQEDSKILVGDQLYAYEFQAMETENSLALRLIFLDLASDSDSDEFCTGVAVYW